MAGNNKQNLKKGGNFGNKGRGSSEDRKTAAKVKAISQKLVLNPVYQAKLKEQLENGTLHPSVQNNLWAYAFGRPTEATEEKKPVPVTIQHVFADTPEEPI